MAWSYAPARHGFLRQAHLAHQSSDRAAGDRKSLPHRLSPNLADATDCEVLSEHARDLGFEGYVLPRPRRLPPLRDMLMIGGRSDRQDGQIGSTPQASR